jgi:hypothetical protein
MKFHNEDPQILGSIIHIVNWVIWQLGSVNPWINFAQFNDKTAINKGVSQL